MATKKTASKKTGDGAAKAPAAPIKTGGGTTLKVATARFPLGGGTAFALKKDQMIGTQTIKKINVASDGSGGFVITLFGE